MDLGGGSTQIVFEPIIKKGQNDAAMHPGEHVYELKGTWKDGRVYAEGCATAERTVPHPHPHRLQTLARALSRSIRTRTWGTV